MNIKKLSIVIVHYNCWNYLKKCLDSIVEQSMLPSELIIVDNASESSIKDNLLNYKNLLFKIKLIENGENLGFATACNIGAKASTQALILFCNPDIVIPKNGLETLIKQYTHNNINLLGCHLIDNNKKPQKVGGLFPHISNMLPVIGRFIKRRGIKKFKKVKNICFSDWITGAVILISKKDFEKIGHWDESYFMYMEDVSLCYKAHNCLMKVGYTSKTKWCHHHGKSSVSRKKDRIKSKSALIQSKHIYINKHFNNKGKYLAHFFIFIKYFPELFIATITAPFIKIEELKIKKQVALNTIKFYLNR